jgi:hypothetical protein
MSGSIGHWQTTSCEVKEMSKDTEHEKNHASFMSIQRPVLSTRGATIVPGKVPGEGIQVRIADFRLSEKRRDRDAFTLKFAAGVPWTNIHFFLGPTGILVPNAC